MSKEAKEKMSKTRKGKMPFILKYPRLIFIHSPGLCLFIGILPFYVRSRIERHETKINFKSLWKQSNKKKKKHLMR